MQHLYNIDFDKLFRISIAIVLISQILIVTFVYLRNYQNLALKLLLSFIKSSPSFIEIRLCLSN